MVPAVHVGSGKKYIQASSSPPKTNQPLSVKQAPTVSRFIGLHDSSADVTRRVGSNRDPVHPSPTSRTDSRPSRIVQRPPAIRKQSARSRNAGALCRLRCGSPQFTLVPAPSGRISKYSRRYFTTVARERFHRSGMRARGKVAWAAASGLESRPHGRMVARPFARTIGGIHACILHARGGGVKQNKSSRNPWPRL